MIWCECFSLVKTHVYLCSLQLQDMLNYESKNSVLDPSTFYSGFQMFYPTEDEVGFVKLGGILCVWRGSAVVSPWSFTIFC